LTRRRPGPAAPGGPGGAVEHEGGRAADDEEEREEERQLEQAHRVVGKRGEVEVDPAHHEEEGNEEAIADRGQLRLEDRDLSALEGDADDHACDESAE
jgi:hypothetical protein